MKDFFIIFFMVLTILLAIYSFSTLRALHKATYVIKKLEDYSVILADSVLEVCTDFLPDGPMKKPFQNMLRDKAIKLAEEKFKKKQKEGRKKDEQDES